MKITDEEIEKDLEVCERATPGEWIYSEVIEVDPFGNEQGLDAVEVCAHEDGPIICRLSNEVNEIPEAGDWKSNAEFIAAARTRWPLYINELKELREELKIYKAQGEIKKICVSA